MGAGKSFVSRTLKDYGYSHLDVDKIAKYIIDKSLECKCKLKDCFGEDVLDNSFNLNREILGLKVFSSTENLLKLGFIVNPYIKTEVKRLINKSESKVVVDAATLFSMGLNEFCKYKIYVTASLDVRRERVSKRDKISKETAAMRVQSQKEEMFPRKKCDFVIDGGLEKIEVLKKISEMIVKIEST